MGLGACEVGDSNQTCEMIGVSNRSASELRTFAGLEKVLGNGFHVHVHYLLDRPNKGEERNPDTVAGFVGVSLLKPDMCEEASMLEKYNKKF